jgi:hypothetical protein
MILIAKRFAYESPTKCRPGDLQSQNFPLREPGTRVNIMSIMLTNILAVCAIVSVPTGFFAAADLAGRATVLDEGTLMPLGIMVGCTVAIVLATWRAANAFRDITGSIRHLREDLGKTRAEIHAVDTRVQHIETLCPECNGNGQPKRKH